MAQNDDDYWHMMIVEAWNTWHKCMVFGCRYKRTKHRRHIIFARFVVAVLRDWRKRKKNPIQRDLDCFDPWENDAGASRPRMKTQEDIKGKKK